MIPQKHQEFIDRASSVLQQDARICAIALCGSYTTGNMDEYSDLDFMLAVEPESFAQVLDERVAIAGKLGDLLSAFTGEHIGVPNLLICLFDAPLMHADFNFIPLDQAGSRFDGTAILYDKNAYLTKTYRNTNPFHPMLDLQWLEDRFWVWVHYTALKIGRGELFEAIDAITFVRATVLGPLLQVKNGLPPRGVRRIESDAQDFIPELMRTVPACDARSCITALQAEIALYRKLRKPYIDAIILRDKAEERASQYANCIMSRCTSV